MRGVGTLFLPLAPLLAWGAGDRAPIFFKSVGGVSVGALIIGGLVGELIFDVAPGIGVAITVAALGLMILAMRAQSLGWLLNANGAALFLTLYSVSFVNIPATVAATNVTRAIETPALSSTLDTEYLRVLDPAPPHACRNPHIRSQSEHTIERPDPCPRSSSLTTTRIFAT